MEADAHPSSIAVTGFGAITPVGENAAQSYAAFRAGLVAISEHAYLNCLPEEPEWDMPLPLYAAHVPALDPTQQGLERFLQLSIPALEEALEHAKLLRSALPATGLLVATPYPTGIAELELQQNLVGQLRARMGLSGLSNHQVLCSGHTGLAEALRRAAIALQQNKLQHVILLAVDTYLLKERISYYDERWRIKSERGVDGFTPGEAACALVVELASTAEDRNANVQGLIKGYGFGQEANPINGQKASTGEGLRQAINNAISISDNADARFIKHYADFNGESYFAYEIGLLQPRFSMAFAELEETVYPATCFGDTGAACAALSVAFACLEGRTKTNKETCSLITSAGDSGNRAALIIESV